MVLQMRRLGNGRERELKRSNQWLHVQFDIDQKGVLGAGMRNVAADMDTCDL